MPDVLTVHRSFYDAIETGDADLMASLWVDSPATTCVHPGAEALQGTRDVLRSWTLVMANVGYIQFFLTDVQVALPHGEDGDLVVITCTENVLSGEDVAVDAFAGAKAVCTSILVRDRTTRDGAGWRFFARHASPVLDVEDDHPEEP